MISTGLQESGLRHHAVSPMGCGKATFSKTRATPAGATPTWRSTNSSTVSTDTGTRLARHLEIDLLAAATTQRPVGRHRVRPGQGYLTEIPSQLPRARALYREITCTEGASNFILGAGAAERVAHAEIVREVRKGKAPSDHAPVLVDISTNWS